MYAFLCPSLSLFLGTTHHLPPLPPCVFCALCSIYCNILCSDCVTFFALLCCIMFCTFLFARIWLSIYCVFYGSCTATHLKKYTQPIGHFLLLVLEMSH